MDESYVLYVADRSIDRVTVRASGRVARWFFNSGILHVIRLVNKIMHEPWTGETTVGILLSTSRNTLKLLER